MDITVHSGVLSVASPVFHAMLGREAETLHTQDKPTVHLPEDDPEALLIILYVLHHQNDKVRGFPYYASQTLLCLHSACAWQVPFSVNLNQLERLAILCDKYDLAQALHHWSTIWLDAWKSYLPKDSQGLLVTFSFRKSEMFTEQTGKIVLKLSSPPELRTHRLNPYLPEQILC